MDHTTPSNQPLLPAVGLLARGRSKVLLFCWLGWVFDFYDLILFSFTKRSIAQALDLELYSAVAWIEGWSLLATAIGGFVFGRIADRIGRRQAMVASILLYSLGALLTGMASGFYSLLMARVITGIGVGGEWGIGHAVVAEHWQGGQRDRVHGILQAGSPVAMGLAAVVGCFLAPLWGWRAVFLISSAPALLALWGRFALPDVDPSRIQPKATAAPAHLLWSPSYRRASAVLFGVLTLHMAGFWCVYAELPAALMQLHRVGVTEVGWFQIKVNAVHLLADLAFGYLAAAFGRIRMFVVFCLIFAGGQVAVMLLLEQGPRDFSQVTLAIAAMGLGAGTWSCFGTLFGTYYPVALRATAAATFYAVARAVQLPLKPLLGAAFAQTGSFAPALAIGATCALFSALLIGLLPRRPGREQPLA